MSATLVAISQKLAILTFAFCNLLFVFFPFFVYVFLRLLHVFLWIAHASLIYVDDSKYLFVDEVAPICSLLVMGLLTACNFPISWGKLQYGKQVNWIGFIWNYASQIFVSCPLAKVEKLQGGLQQLLVAGTRVSGMIYKAPRA